MSPHISRVVFLVHNPIWCEVFQIPVGLDLIICSRAFHIQMAVRDYRDEGVPHRYTRLVNANESFDRSRVCLGCLDLRSCIQGSSVITSRAYREDSGVARYVVLVFGTAMLRSAYIP